MAASIIAVVNQKGGVGKTTTAVNITAALRAIGKRTLLCDFDPQANATSGMGVDKNTASPNVYDVLINGAEPEKALVSTKYGDVLPSNKALAGAGIEMIAIPDREHLLKNALERLAPNYDYIFIDCPPSLELLTVNALCAAGSLLVPVQCEYYALEGLSDLLATVRLVKRGLNPKLSIEARPRCGSRFRCRPAANRWYLLQSRRHAMRRRLHPGFYAAHNQLCYMCRFGLSYRLAELRYNYIKTVLS